MMCVGMFMAILDVQVVATSLPAIQGALGIPPDQMSWVQTAYLIAEVIAIPLTGFLTRALSMRWLFVLSRLASSRWPRSAAPRAGSFGTLVAWRVLQGFSGGTLIPAVFSAVFLLFPVRRQGIATTFAGVLAVLAPTVGPIVGGWITETYSWHWLFLINIVARHRFGHPRRPACCREQPMRPREVRSLDVLSLAHDGDRPCRAGDRPQGGADARLDLRPGTGSSGAQRRERDRRSSGARSRAASDARRSAHVSPTADFAIGCVLSFVLGIGLFGSVYLMPVFLAFVRYHDALEIGTIMLVTGVAQLVTAPVAVALEQRLDARWLTALGFRVVRLSGWA